MNANTPRRNPAEWREGAQLLSRTARDLPTGRHQFHKERLMARIEEQQVEQDQHERKAPVGRPGERGSGTWGPWGARDADTDRGGRRLRLLRPAVALPLAAAVVAGVVVAGTVLNDGGGVRKGVATVHLPTTRIDTATSEGVPQLLDRVSLAAARSPHSDVRPGQYVYIESKVADAYVSVVEGEASMGSHPLHRRQIWKSADGTKGWLIDPAVNEGPEGETLSLPDERGEIPEASLNAPSYDYLAGLTTDPDELLALIYKETEGQGRTPHQQAFTTIGDLLGESYPPARLYPALFRAAKKIPGVVVVPDVEDAIGRKGVAVARLDKTSGQREEWIFDKKTHVFLGERVVQVLPATGEDAVIKPGQVTHLSAILKRAVVDGMKRTPGRKG
ncbi:CU044_5270 family protein [Streptomyces sp. JNUCC 64]